MTTKQAQKGASIRTKNINVDTRVLTSVEGRREVQWLRKEATEKEWLLNEALTQKAAEDQARWKRRADISYIFTGPLNKARRKEELEDIALALSLSDSGKKDDIYNRICYDKDLYDRFLFIRCTDTGVTATHTLSFYRLRAPLFLLTHAQLAVVTQSCALRYIAAHCDLLLQ